MVNIAGYDDDKTFPRTSVELGCLERIGKGLSGAKGASDREDRVPVETPLQKRIEQWEFKEDRQEEG